MIRDLHTSFQRLHRDESGTSMTEFVISLPLFIVIFGGFLELGELAQESVGASEQSKLKTFEKFLEVQSSGDGLRELAGKSAGYSTAPHLNNVTGGGAAGDQLLRYPPRRPSPTGRALLTAYEGNTYRKLAQKGHTGEASARLKPTTASGRYSPSGVKDLLLKPEQRIYGRQANDMVLAPDLLSDRVTKPTSSGPGNCKDFLGILSQNINQVLSATGSRPMLAAGIRYGTVTGEVDAPAANIAGMKVDVHTYWNTLVAPHVFENPHSQTAIATFTTRMALKSCVKAPYSRLLGISRGGEGKEILGKSRGSTRDRKLPDPDNYKLKVPDPYPNGNYQEAGFNPPLMYRGKGLKVNYD